MTWNDPKIKILLDNITETGRQDDLEYNPNPFDGPLARHATSLHTHTIICG